MDAVVIHARKDLRIQALATPALGARDVRVRIAAGGICGSDLHYYHHGGFGTVRIQEPMVLGHEVAGRVEAVGPQVSRVTPGDRVAVSPSHSCGECRYCREGLHNHCLEMRFYGSAMRSPHVQGAFRQTLVAHDRQCYHVASHVSMSEAAMAEPLAVCLHAVRRAGPLLGRRVLVTGSGPIGCLCIISARLAGAVEIVATDVSDVPLAAARKVGADRTINVAASPPALSEYERDKGAFDVLFEASGNVKALEGALGAMRPGGIIIQVGLGESSPLPLNTIVAKELELRGTFRFHEEFALAVELMERRRVDVLPLLSATLPFRQAVEAFELASDRSRAMKVQLSFA